MYWVDGKPTEHTLFSDRSFQYGDGCFSTILTRDGVLQLWPLHQARLNAALTMLSIPQPDWLQVKQWLDKAALPHTLAGVKIHISRGQGGRGYSPEGFSAPTVTISAFPFPDHYATWQKKGITLGIANIPLGINPLLAGYKHNNRLEQILIRGELAKAGFADGIALDVRGFVTETTVANLFWVRDGVCFTPELDMAGVAGVMRRVVLSELEKDEYPVEIGHYSLKELLLADEVFITNSIFGVVPVIKIHLTSFGLGPLSDHLQKRVIEC